MKNIINKIINNEYAFSVFSKVLGVFTGVCYSVLYSRYLQATFRGEASVITTYVDLGTLIFCFGVYQGYPHFRKKKETKLYKEYINLIFGFIVLYIILGLFFICIVRPVISVCTIVMMLPLSIGIKELNYVVMIENPISINKTSIVLSVMDNVIVIIFMLAVEVDYIACILLLVIKEVVYFAFAIKRLDINFLTIRPTLNGASRYIRFGFLPMLTVLMMEINYKADVLLLEWLNINKADIGVYTLGVSLAQRIWMIPDAMKDILLSKLAKGKNKDEVCKVTRINIFIVAIFSMFLAIVGRLIIELLYGEEYSEAYTIILTLLVGIFGMIFYKSVYSYNVIQGDRWKNFIFLGVAASVNVFLDVFLIPEIGIWGAAIASTLSYSICGLFFLNDFCKKTTTGYYEMIFITKRDILSITKLLGIKR